MWPDAFEPPDREGGEWSSKDERDELGGRVDPGERRKWRKRC